MSITLLYCTFVVKYIREMDTNPVLTKLIEKVYEVWTCPQGGPCFLILGISHMTEVMWYSTFGSFFFFFLGKFSSQLNWNNWFHLLI